MPTHEELAACKTEIERRYGSVYRFSLVSGIGRGLLSMLFRDLYPGDGERQLRRIRAALDGAGDMDEALFLAIKEAACRRCHVRGECSRCDAMFRDQATAAMVVISKHGYK